MKVDSATMREVVETLHRARAQPLSELQEFEGALSAVWAALSALVAMFHDIAVDVRIVNELGRTQPKTLGLLATRMEQAAAVSDGVVAAMAEICRGVRGWAVAERGEDGKPRSLLTTPVP